MAGEAVKIPEEIDFSQFWGLIKKPDGTVSKAPFFLNEKFEEMFGNEATEAFSLYQHFAGNRDKYGLDKFSDKDRKSFQSVTKTLEEIVGIHPEIIYEAQADTKLIVDI